jgi:hypothetical protein
VKPGGAAGVVGGLKCAGGDLAKVIDEYVMVFHPAFGIAHDALEDFHYFEQFDREAGFFQDFAADGLT